MAKPGTRLLSYDKKGLAVTVRKGELVAIAVPSSTKLSGGSPARDAVCCST